MEKTCSLRSGRLVASTSPFRSPLASSLAAKASTARSSAFQVTTSPVLCSTSASASGCWRAWRATWSATLSSSPAQRARTAWSWASVFIGTPA